MTVNQLTINVPGAHGGADVSDKHAEAGGYALGRGISAQRVLGLRHTDGEGSVAHGGVALRNDITRKLSH